MKFMDIFSSAPPRGEDRETSSDQIEVLKEVRERKQKVQAENRRLLEDAHRCATHATRQIAEVIGAEAGLDVGPILHGPRHAIRNKLAVIRSAVALMDEQATHQEMLKYRAMIESAAREIAEILNGEREAELLPEQETA